MHENHAEFGLPRLSGCFGGPGGLSGRPGLLKAPTLLYFSLLYAISLILVISLILYSILNLTKPQRLTSPTKTEQPRTDTPLPLALVVTATLLALRDRGGNSRAAMDRRTSHKAH